MWLYAFNSECNRQTYMTTAIAVYALQFIKTFKFCKLTS